jgi:hypothetical protein
MTEELEGMWKEVVGVYVVVLSPRSPGRSEEQREKTSVRIDDIFTKMRPRDIEIAIITFWSNLLGQKS